MQEQQRAQLVAALRANPQFAAALATATDVEAAAAVARRHGVELDANQLSAAVHGVANLSDSELAAAAGGGTEAGRRTGWGDCSTDWFWCP